MKKQKSFLIRILSFLLCTIFLFSIVFMSYENTLIVKANDVEYVDLLRDAFAIALATGGVIATDGALIPALIPYVSTIGGAGFDLYEYVTDNGDGTTTISEDFTQLVLQAYNQYKEDNAAKFNGIMPPCEDGYYYFPEITFTCFYAPGNKNYNNTEHITDIYTYYPCAVYLKGLVGYIIFYNSKSDEFYCIDKILGSGDSNYGIICPATETFLCPTTSTCIIVDKNVYQRYFTRIHVIVYDSNPPAGSGITADSQYIPVYHDIDALKHGLSTGDFSAAYNYGKIPDCETSKYTGSYSGGDITVQTEKLGNIEDKLDEINETDKSIDDKLQDLLDWLKGDGSGSGSGGIGAPSGWYETVLAYLESILSALEALVWIEADDSISEDQKDLFDLIDKIWQDPENGSQEAADALSGSFSDVARGLTKKFPFSIPWDIHALFTVFANAGNPEPAVVSYSAEPAVMSYAAESAVLYSDSGGIQTYAGDSGIITQEDHNAPYFVLPLVIESWGINEQVVIDLKDFQTLSTLSRTLFSLLFAVFLIKFTISVIKIYKGGSDD